MSDPGAPTPSNDPQYGAQPYPAAGQQYPPAGQQYAPAPGYPTMPADYQAGQPIRRPGTLLAGVIMTYVGGGVLTLIGAFVGLFAAVAGDEFQEGFSSGFSGAVGGTDVSGGGFTAVIIGVMAGILVQGVALIVLAVFTQKGRNGARIALTVIGGLNIAYNLYQLSMGQTVGVVSLIYVGLVLTFLWVSGANQWFAQQAAARRSVQPS